MTTLNWLILSIALLASVVLFYCLYRQLISAAKRDFDALERQINQTGLPGPQPRDAQPELVTP